MLSKLTYGTYIIESAEGSQQGDPLSGLQFCETVHPTLSGGTARIKLGFVDDFNLEGKFSDAEKDVQIIIEAQAATGLVLNRHKCEIIANNFDLVDKFPIFDDLKRIYKEDMTLLCAPVLSGRATDKVLQEKISDLDRAIDRLSLLQARDALCLLKNSIAIPKLLYILRTSPCFDNPFLVSLNDALKRDYRWFST